MEKGDGNVALGRTEQLLQSHYKKAILKHGDTPEGAQWSSKETQEKRFEILLDIEDIKGSSVLDFGCGTGAMLDYLNKRALATRYTGCDIVEEALQIAKKKFAMLPKARFGFFEEFSADVFDYTFVSGVFNNKVEDNKAYYQNYLKSLWERTKKGLAFNMMSYYVDYYDDELFYEKPENVFSFVKDNLSPFVVLRNDYQVKQGIIPFEFTVYVYRKEFARR